MPGSFLKSGARASIDRRAAPFPLVAVRLALAPKARECRRSALTAPNNLEIWASLRATGDATTARARGGCKPVTLELMLRLGHVRWNSREASASDPRRRLRLNPRLPPTEVRAARAAAAAARRKAAPAGSGGPTAACGEV